MMTAFYGYSMMFYEITSNVKHWVTWNLFDELEAASVTSDGQERDFRSEIQSALYTSPNSDYESAHCAIMVEYEKIETDKKVQLLLQEEMRAKTAMEKENRRVISAQQKELQNARIAAITDPNELLQMEVDRQESIKAAKRCFDDSAGADGDDSDSSASSVDSEISTNVVKTGKVNKELYQKSKSSKRSRKGSNKRVAIDANIKPSQIPFDNKDSNDTSTSENCSDEQPELMKKKSCLDLRTTDHSPPISNPTRSKNQQPDDFLFSGIAHDSSLLHEVDIGSDIDSDGQQDEEFDFENPGKLFSSTSKSQLLQTPNNNRDSHSSSKSGNKNKTGRRTRTVNPEKLKTKEEAEKLHQATKEIKIESARKRREDFKNDRRVELASIFDASNLADDDGESGKIKKKRSCPISSDTVQHYVSDLNLNILTATTTITQQSALIANAVNTVVGAAASAAGISSSMTTTNNNRPNFDALSTAEKMSIVDRNFKDGLMMYCQAELFKDVTFERLIVNYCIAKREISGMWCIYYKYALAINFLNIIVTGASDEEILDIDWFEVLSEFRVSLEKRLVDNKNFVLDAIKLAIDGIIDETLSCVDRETEKDKYVESADAWIKHGVRMIRAVVSKCLTKVGSYWEAMNFLPPGALKSTIVSSVTNNKFSLFANTASQYQVLNGNGNGHRQQVGIDSFLYQVLRSSPPAGGTNNAESHMNKLIQFTKIPRDKYKIIPGSQQAVMENWLVSSSSKPTAATAAIMSTPSTPSLTTKTTTSEDNNNYTNNSHDKIIESSSVSSPTTSVDSGDSYTYNTDDNNTSKMTTEFTTISDKMQSLTVSSNPQLSDLTTFTESVKFHMKELLKILYAGVSGQDSNMCLKLNAINNSRNIDGLGFMKFLEENKEKSIDQLVLNFETSLFFKKFTSSFFVPIKQSDRSNIIGDGYCFYRTLFLLYLRSQDGAFEMSAKEMKDLDDGLRHTENEIRGDFYNFFDKLFDCLPEEYGKSRVLQSRFLFFHIMNCSLDQRFWGVLDGIAYLPFECCGFGEHDDPILSGQWAKYYCSSIFRLNGVNVNSGSIGSSPTFADILSILEHHPNFAIFKSSHFFVSEQRTRLEMQTSFELCLEVILAEFQNRFEVASTAFLSKADDGVNSGVISSMETNMTWSSLCGRMESGLSTYADVECVRAATEILVDHLQNKQVILEEEAERKKSNVNKKKVMANAPPGATEDQKKLFSLTSKVITFY
jgi:hypothetical protein